MLITMASIRKNAIVQENMQLFSFLGILDITLFLVMFAFNSWNWYLAMVGYSTIEWWSECLREPAADKVYFSFSFKTVDDNLYKIFGTNKLLRILSPSMRNVQFTGLEWAFLLKDLGYSQEGTKFLSDVEM